ncbi:docking protein 1b [Megalops cyprinoides]|uniref:docking protein 1b n=1 Tax=Megalops cyprinoides TaxID=118141 RepID=UPI00186566A5|nr:docking protein 1b [Megalops cyprinoides]
MDTHVKEGQLYVQHQKFGKKWKKNWFVLYPASQNGIARLEFFDCSSGSEKPNTKKLDKKIIRLSECISILPALTETCPKDNMAAFCVETNDKTHVFAAEKHISAEWVEKMCEIAFQGGGGTDSNGQQELQMAENLIYYSREEVNEFWVSVQRTEASERCGLQGAYWLKADSDSLILKEPKTKRSLLVWPYKLLRRYGRDKVMFSFEAGRRCESGPGNFTFETKQGNEIFGIVEGAIREQKAQAEERHQSCPSLESDCPALQQARATIAEGNRDPDVDSGGSKPGSADGVFGRREGEGKNLKGRSLPEPPPAVSGTPPRSPLPRGPRTGAPLLPEDQSSLYSEPADSVRVPASPADCLYSDPVDSIKVPTPAPRQRPPGEGGKPEPLYSDIYDRVSLDLLQRTGALGLEVRPRNGAGQAEGAAVEHIYDEPEGRGGVPGGATLYDEARLEPNAWRSRGLEEPLQGHEVPYNPSTDDYSVPAYSKPPRSKGPKPLTAPKPTKVLLPRKDPPQLPQGNANNNNSSPGSGGKHVELYSQVSRPKVQPSTWYPHSSLQSPDIIYDNLGNI